MSLQKVFEQEEESGTFAATIKPGHDQTEAPIKWPT
jgi:hypothetical protein